MSAIPSMCKRCQTRLLRRHISTTPHPSRPLSTTGGRLTFSSTSSAPSFDALKRRPAKFIPDYLSPTPSHLLETTLADLLKASPSVPFPPAAGAVPQSLPQGHHLVYFPIQTPPSRLAADGADLDHSPGEQFARRLWAGGEVVFHAGWREALALDGRACACKEEIRDVVSRGAEGQEKVFVDVWRQYGSGHGREGESKAESSVSAQSEETTAVKQWDIEERRTLVFMRNEGLDEARSTTSATTSRPFKYPHSPDHTVSLTPSSTHLFHFSALTFNAHAIHVDPSYARNTDGHRGLLVHGPLTLALMLRVLTDHTKRDVQRITYRNFAPLYVDEELRVCVRRASASEWDVWVEGPDGGLAVKGTAMMSES